MASAAEIRNRAAKKLGLFGTGQTLRSEMAADIDKAYEEVFAELDKQEIASWSFAGEVPDELVRPVVSLVAGARVDEYSVPAEKYARIVRESSEAEDRIRKMLAKPKTDTTVIEEF